MSRFGNDHRRHEGRQRLRGLARRAAPGEQLLWRQAMPARNLRDDRSGNQRLFNNLRPIVGAPPPPAYRPRDHLEATHLALRLKSMVKSRHKTILQIRIVRLGPQLAAKKVRSKHRLLKVEVWEGDKIHKVMAVVNHATVAIAAYEAAVRERQGRVVTLRHGARVLRSTEPAKPPVPPTVGHLRTLGVTGVRLWCVSCGRSGVLSFEAIRAGDDEPFPTAGKRSICAVCHSRNVQRMPEWP